MHASNGSEIQARIEAAGVHASNGTQAFESAGFLEALAITLCVAAVTTIVCQRLRQPVVLGYMLAGLIVGPHVPLPLVADRNVVHTLSELGVILLMFSLGLEFRLRKLVQRRADGRASPRSCSAASCSGSAS